MSPLPYGGGGTEQREGRAKAWLHPPLLVQVCKAALSLVNLPVHTVIPSAFSRHNNNLPSSLPSGSSASTPLTSSDGGGGGGGLTPSPGVVLSVLTSLLEKAFFSCLSVVRFGRNMRQSHPEKDKTAWVAVSAPSPAAWKQSDKDLWGTQVLHGAMTWNSSSSLSGSWARV